MATYLSLTLPDAAILGELKKDVAATQHRIDQLVCEHRDKATLAIDCVLNE